MTGTAGKNIVNGNIESRRLLQGQFFGRIVRCLRIAGMILTETVYPPRAEVPCHSHESPYFCLVLEGGYSEIYDRKNREVCSMTLAFHPSGERHSERFYEKPVRSFNVEAQSDWLSRVRQYSKVLDHASEFRAGPVLSLGLKLYAEFVEADSVGPLAIEGLALELMVATSRETTRSRSRRPAAWLLRARDLIRSRFDTELSVLEIAAAVDVHPGHLAREFRRHFRCTMGEYVRCLRVELSSRQILEGRASLVEIAANAGFFDQSHLTRTFKALTGFTPGKFRDSFVSRATVDGSKAVPLRARRNPSEFQTGSKQRLAMGPANYPIQA